MQTVANPPTEPATSSISLTDFIEQFGDSLCEAVCQQNPPVYASLSNAQRSQILSTFKRAPFPAQQRVIEAITTLLVDEGERAAIINAEMGTGKSLMGTAVATLLHHAGFKRSLVLCPPHLVYKWRREILETVPDAAVIVLNGQQTLSTLIALKAIAKQPVTVPTFYIMGRIRLRLGHEWRPAFITRYQYMDESGDEKKPPKQIPYVACPRCGKFVKDNHGFPITRDQFNSDKKQSCVACHEPLWALVRKSALPDPQQIVAKALCQLPTIGSKQAEKLVKRFGVDLLGNSLGDNIYQLINLLDEEGNPVFSARTAERLERALSQLEFSDGQSVYQASEFIKRYLPHFFSVLIVDEAHEYKGAFSAQGQAMAVVASGVKKVVLLTGTLMGGYADDIFYLLQRMMPERMRAEGFAYSARRSLSSASLNFMERYGVLKRTLKIREGGDFRTAKGKRHSTHVAKAPGFSPQGIARFVLPYTAFLKLEDLDNHTLPPYQEYCESVAMLEIQEACYTEMEQTLTQELRRAWERRDMTLLGVVLMALLAWPECSFRPEKVVHPRTRKVLFSTPALLKDEDISPKEARLIELCLNAKKAGRKTLVYTIYTGIRDTTVRLQRLLTEAGLQTTVLRASVKADQREMWIMEQLDKGMDVLLCNPELVKTGLDLLSFPTIVFMQSGYNVYTLMQAARRSWRIGQIQPVEVYFLGYEKTAQMACLSLMAKKIAVTQSTSGKMPDSGLNILNSDGESIEMALARKLLSKE
ncbi:MAG: hypothetical protein K0R24_999 [Gammaproteobacteria bacterium]|jgi:superfamily II DNA or RNA helicase|nr:hypothetical protein [Gammaproteobacteria bacterium]